MCGAMPLCTIRSGNEMSGIYVFPSDCVLLYMVLLLLPVETSGLRVGCLGELDIAVTSAGDLFWSWVVEDSNLLPDPWRWDYDVRWRVWS